MDLLLLSKRMANRQNFPGTLLIQLRTVFVIMQVDYNLYGMGHLHLSKVKFRHPIPESYFRRKFNYDIQHEMGLDNLPSNSADFQVTSISLCTKWFGEL